LTIRLTTGEEISDVLVLSSKKVEEISRDVLKLNREQRHALDLAVVDCLYNETWLMLSGIKPEDADGYIDFLEAYAYTCMFGGERYRHIRIENGS